MLTHHSFFKVDLGLFYAKVNFGHLSIYMEKMKLIYFSKTTAADCRCIDLNNLINLHEYQRSLFFDLAKGQSCF